MHIHHMILAAALAAGFAIPAAAHDAREGGLKPVQSQRIDLGRIAGDAYYTIERHGYRVVATFAERGARQGDTGTPVRFEAVLARGQAVIFSSPHEAGAPADAVEISRQNDQVIVHAAAAVD